MGEAQTPHFYDVEILDVPRPTETNYSFLRTPGYLNKNQEKPWNTLKHIIFIDLKVWDTQEVVSFSTRRAPTNDEDPLNKILKILDMG